MRPAWGGDHFSSIRLTAGGPRRSGVRLIPGNAAGGQPFPCSVLHHAGFAVPPRLPSERWALTPPFHPYPLPKLGAVFFLLHFPSGSACTDPAPAFTRRAALWCPDFPRGSRRNETPAIARGVDGHRKPKAGKWESPKIKKSKRGEGRSRLCNHEAGNPPLDLTSSSPVGA